MTWHSNKMRACSDNQTTLTPSWVVPPASQISDLHWLGYRRYADTGLAWPAGVCASLEWVLSERNAPITERNERPVSDGVAKAEMWAATAVDRDGVKPSLESICANLDVAYFPAVILNRTWARSVCMALRWMLGGGGFAEAKPPLELPTRHADGSIASADELYAQAMGAHPDHNWG
ncbi:MAG: hypothetical protein LC749_13625, partial [Actinobacteria bacterium]|nr:hypothetical protein [Actinomycetota bacterium]